MSGSVEELKALLEKAAVAPWETMIGGEFVDNIVCDDWEDPVAQRVEPRNSALIVWLVNNAPALISAQAEEIERLKAVEEEAIFLTERLADFDNDSGNKTEDGERDWHGNVAPSLSRLKKAVQARAAFQSSTDGMGEA